MSKPVVARLANGAEYGFRDAATALNIHPDATIVAYQDGSAYEADGDKRPNLKAMKRHELESYAAVLGIENPFDKDAFPSVPVLRETIEAAIADIEVNGDAQA